MMCYGQPGPYRRRFLGMQKNWEIPTQPYGIVKCDEEGIYTLNELVWICDNGKAYTMTPPRIPGMHYTHGIIT